MLSLRQILPGHLVLCQDRDGPTLHSVGIWAYFGAGPYWQINPDAVILIDCAPAHHSGFANLLQDAWQDRLLNPGLPR